ncbi:elongation factor Ts [Candidatus Thiomargarita nelsonii]|uniref:Elongation factor Ts n=1 Tax=Candidatus Thiomargarita nelsonii TaxID=1003181 RepID=A0A0A6PK23_9GAMM|nr:elongation factor Ts [Candidatus Thiomargarita nelsonii]
MKISAALVKELRERTGAGMMECKKALVESGGDIEAAISAMRKSGQAKAAKKAGRIAAEGLIVIQQDSKHAAMVEVNSETDFVSKGDDFKDFCDAVAATVLRDTPNNLESLMAANLVGGEKSIEDARKDLIGKIGENVNVRRFALMETGNLAVYLHGTRIGVLVDMRAGNAELAKDIAMHIAASRPVCVSGDQVPAETIAKEKEIFAAQAANSGKPANIIEKMVEGRLRKFLGEITLLGQPFVKDPDQSVEKLLKANQASVAHFERFEVGEGIDKKSENFADEVMQQVQGT